MALEAARKWDVQIATLTDLRDTFRSRVEQEQLNLAVTERSLEMAVAARAELDALTPPARELYRREFTPPVAEEDLQLGTDQ